jgi:hypothetical protein
MSSSGFQLPPIIRNARGEIRKAGFELEYTGLSLESAAVIVTHVFGGRHASDTASVQRVKETKYGTFKLEMDTTVLKDRKYEPLVRAVGIDPAAAERAIAKLFAVAGVPYEIVTPPIPIDQLCPLDEMRRLLQQNEAAGSRASLRYAFGMHINPEIPSDDPRLLRDYVRAFLLLYPSLKKRVKVDISRSISPYINPFPDDYVRLVLQPDYPADSDRLIDDYLRHNPTRNRPLDMLPVLCHLDEQRVMARVEEKNLVKARAAFHYRLPNCLVDEPDWTLAREWNTWVDVERLANDPEKIAAMSVDYLT